VAEVSDGLEAVQKAQELKPDLVLIDVGLPHLNGIETGQRIRRILPESEVLLLSQESDADLVHETLNLGTPGYVVKRSGGSELLSARRADRQLESISEAILPISPRRFGPT
jgi:DNA-binding NarL/FixJ family response regulator